MADPVQTPQSAAQIETVPKSDFERIKTQADESSRNLEVLRQQLTDPDYIAFRESKTRPKAPTLPTNTPVNLNAMTLEQLQAMIEQGVATTVQQVIKPLYSRIDNLDAQQELDLVSRKHEDFDDFREQVATILKNTPNELTIEQAYWMAKAQAPTKTPEPKQGSENTPVIPKSGNEKPSSNVPVGGDTIKSFKNENEAGQAAWKSVAEKYGLSGDTI